MEIYLPSTSTTINNNNNDYYDGNNGRLPWFRVTSSAVDVIYARHPQTQLSIKRRRRGEEKIRHVTRGRRYAITMRTKNRQRGLGNGRAEGEVSFPHRTGEANKLRKNTRFRMILNFFIPPTSYSGSFNSTLRNFLFPEGKIYKKIKKGFHWWNLRDIYIK